MDDENKLRELYFNLKSWEEHTKFMKVHPHFLETEWDEDVMEKFEQLQKTSSNFTCGPIMVHEEVLDRSKPNPFGVKLD